MNLVILGAGFAGINAALKCLELYPEDEVYLIDKEAKFAYYPNALNAYLKNEINDLSKAKYELYEKLTKSKVNLIVKANVFKIDPHHKIIHYKKGKTLAKLAFDYLILALGSRQDWERNDVSEYLINTKTYDELVKSTEKLKKAKTLNIIGAGQIALESLSALAKLELKINIFEARKIPLSKYLDEDMASFIIKELASRKINLYLNETINSLNIQNNKIIASSLKNSYESDYALISTNLCANSTLLKDNFNLHYDGTILVDDYLKTNFDYIFAIGDLITYPNMLKARNYLPNINNAIISANIAAMNLKKERVKITNILKQTYLKFFNYYIYSIGLNSEEAKLYTKVFSYQTHNEDYQFKLIIDTVNRNIIGAQLVSLNDYLNDMNILLNFIKYKININEIVSAAYLNDSLNKKKEAFFMDVIREIVFKGFDHVDS